MTGAYSFLPWLRQGIATHIGEVPEGQIRASVTVRLRIDGAPRNDGATITREVGHDVQLYGPGDVVGMDPRAIVRTEPRDWVTNFDPNYLAFVEFYQEDFCWRYSPAAPDAATGRLAPWLALIVLTEDEFDDAATAPGRPLPAITVDDLDLLPPPGELGAFAHVHVNREITGGLTETENMAEVLPRLANTLAENPDLACSRLICPRRLDPLVAYHAFLVPAFETGRLAGLGHPLDGVSKATDSSWSPYEGRPDSTTLPFYHRWSFRTAPSGDFEYLARLLKPRRPGARVGNRDMDTRDPGAGLPPATPADPTLDRVLRLGGALAVPDSALSPGELEERRRYENWDEPYPHEFQVALAELINLSDAYTRDEPAAVHSRIAGLADAGPDPLVTPPLYGRWHARVNRLIAEGQGGPQPNPRNWVHELNLDPRFRVAAGIGARVVRAHQEEYMQAAWAQLGEVLEANRRIRGGQFAREIGHALHGTHLKSLDKVAPARALTVTAPLHSRVVPARIADTPEAAPNRSVAAQFAESRIAGAPVSAAMRRQTRPGSRLMRRLSQMPAAAAEQSSLLERINLDQVRAAPKKIAPPGITTVDRLERELQGGGVGHLTDPAHVPNPVNTLPKSEDFLISLPGEGVKPHAGERDGAEAMRFKKALNAAYDVFEASAVAGQTPARQALSLPAIGKQLLKQVHPDETIPRRVTYTIRRFDAGQFVPLGPEKAPPDEDPLAEVMAYPIIDLPMYQPLLDLSKELFLPNLNLLPPDSITVLRTNQRFIEAYMVGLNHEMAREMLWREYPCDQRGTLFRQFWDVRGVRVDPHEPQEERRLRLLDIPPIHEWSGDSALGEHDNREPARENDEELVLVIRGELLKKYPNAVVYAHHALWRTKPDGSPDPSQERRLADLDPADPDPPDTIVKLPLYEARADPDIYFFGFDLNEADAKGGSGAHPADDAGWFFVLKERPGDARFGLDLNRDGNLQVWNDLAWPDVLTQPPDGRPRYLRPGSVPSLALEPPTDPVKQEQYAEDREIEWSPVIGSADLAYILYQAPVMIAVHAREMLVND